MKRTHKFKELKDVEAVVAKASSLTAAAKALGVDRSTLHRWLGAGKVKRPRSKPPLARSADRHDAVPTGSPESWAEGLRRQYSLSGTDLELLQLAADALLMAKDTKAAARDRLAATGRFQQLVRQLNLESLADARPATPAQARTAPARRQPNAGDPRAVLMAVK